MQTVAKTKKQNASKSGGQFRNPIETKTFDLFNLHKQTTLNSRAKTESKAEIASSPHFKPSKEVTTREFEFLFEFSFLLAAAANDSAFIFIFANPPSPYPFFSTDSHSSFQQIDNLIATVALNSG
ncbi:hypothetical protein CDAR_310881 [Caerostris darwini]|uniref:Uncharacterized protein n=1 Tax=Caerostris darwini TaxID=1538125 RepID=A0AAV4VQE1_9ARAC|nr:hypothetical protein CDAR_310881 [Caerostris darwini]